MPASNDTALAFAAHLRSLSDAELVTLLGARELREAGIKDFFDLSDALLDPASVQQALSRLDRPTLAAIATVGELGTASIPDAAAHLTAAGTDEAAVANLRHHLATAVREWAAAARQEFAQLPEPDLHNRTVRLVEATLLREAAEHPLVARARTLFDAAIRKVEPPRPREPRLAVPGAAVALAGEPGELAGDGEDGDALTDEAGHMEEQHG